MNYFGPTLSYRIGKQRHVSPIPVGEPCLYCNEIIVATDVGVVMPYIGEILNVIFVGYLALLPTSWASVPAEVEFWNDKAAGSYGSLSSL